MTNCKEKVAGMIEYRKNLESVEESFWAKVRAVGKKLPFLRDAFALYDFVRDPVVHWTKKSVALAALVYFISPIDVIPDFKPVIGYLDDAMVIRMAIEYYRGQIDRYY